MIAGVGAATVGVDGIVSTLAVVAAPTLSADVVLQVAVLIVEAVALAVAAFVRTRAIRVIAGVIEVMLASITLLMALAVLALLALFSMGGSGAGGSMISAPTEAGVLAVVAVALGLGLWAAARLCLALVLFARKPAPAAPSIE